MSSRLVDDGAALLCDRGYEVTRPDSGAEPPGLATPDDDADPPFGPPRETAIDPLADADPTTVLSRLWTNRNHDRATLFVVDRRDTATAVAELLAPPLGVADADEAGRRTFYDGPDRVPLAEGGYAAVPARDDVEWREVGEGERSEASGGRRRGPDGRAANEGGEGERSEPSDGRRRGQDGRAAGDGDDERADNEDGTAGGSGTESAAGGSSRLELRADGEAIGALDGVGELDHPPRAAFPYSYERDDDKRIRVRDFRGRPVETFGGVRAMREGGFAPVAAPLVPEHMLDGDVDGWWGVYVVADDALVTGAVGSAER